MSTDKLNVGQELVKRLQNFNDNIDSIMNKQEPIAWAVMQPDSYRVFISYNQAVTHREDCAGGDIMPLYKQEHQIQSMLDAIRSAQVDTLELPEITDKNKSTVEPKKLPKKMKLDIERNDLLLISEALVVYQFEVEDDKTDYYGFPYSVEQIQKVLDYIEKVLDK
jgi:hypothetical protein